MDFFAHRLAYAFHQLLVPGAGQQCADREVGAVICVLIAITGRVDAEAGRTVGQHYARNAQAFDGVGGTGCPGNNALGSADGGVITAESSHAGADHEMDFFFKGHSFEDPVHRCRF